MIFFGSEWSLNTGLTLAFQADTERIKKLSDRLIKGITSQVEHVIRNGDSNGYPGCVNLSFAYVEVSVSYCDQ